MSDIRSQSKMKRGFSPAVQVRCVSRIRVDSLTAEVLS